MDKASFSDRLALFTGTEAYHQASFPKWLLLSDGASFFIAEAEANWLLDALVGSVLATMELPVGPRLDVRLTVKEGKADLTVVGFHHLEFREITIFEEKGFPTDCPSGDFNFCLEMSEMIRENPVWVLGLASET